MKSKIILTTVVMVVAIVASVFFARFRVRMDDRMCGKRFLFSEGRCCPVASSGGTCRFSESACPRPLVWRDGGCTAPGRRAPIVATTLELGDRVVHVAPFSIDAFEATVSDVQPLFPGRFRREMENGDTARAAYGLSRDEAEAYCASRGGRLPTDDEWTAAAAGGRERGGVTRRFPWGDRGIACRHAAWRGENGTCALGADTVGAHWDGTTPGGIAEQIHDMAGNVAEWVAGSGTQGVVRGGAWSSKSAEELTTTSRRLVDADVHDDSIGVRCAY